MDVAEREMELEKWVVDRLTCGRKEVGSCRKGSGTLGRWIDRSHTWPVAIASKLLDDILCTL